MNIKKVYRAYIQHLGEGNWRVDYYEYNIHRETESRYYYYKNGWKYNRQTAKDEYTINYEAWFNKGAKNSVFETKEEALKNLTFRRKRMQEYNEYKIKYNKEIINILETGGQEGGPAYF